MSTDPDTPEREKQVVALLRTAAQTERAPAALRAQVAAARDRSAETPRRRALRRPVLNLTRVAMPAAAAAAAALVLALGGGAGAPSVAQAALLADRGSSAAAPRPDPGSPARLLSASVGNLHFPNWRSDAGWRAVGQRHDRAGDRNVTTVYYAARGTEIAYSIVSSPALSGSRSGTEPYSTMSRHGRTTVVWVQDGHTCLLSGTGLSPARLWQLASIR